jgi:uncharacterized protein YijF (DUF1287 family)
MSLPYRQQWQLRQIDHALRRSDPHLAAMLAIFTRLTASEKVPAVEPLGAPAWRLLAPLLGVAVIVSAWVARGTRRAGRRMVAGARRLTHRPGAQVKRRPAGSQRLPHS